MQNNERYDNKVTFFKRRVVDGGLEFTPSKANCVIALLTNSSPSEIVHDLLNAETAHIIAIPEF